MTAASRPRPGRRAVGLALALLACASPAWGASDDPPEWRERQPPERRAAWDALEGSPAPPLSTLSGWRGSEPLGWEALRGRAVLLCLGPAGTERRRGARALRRLEILQAERAGDGLVVVAVQPRDDAEEASPRAGRSHALVTADDEAGAFAAALAADSRPAYFLVGRDGRVRVAGLSDEDDAAGRWIVSAAVDAVLAEPWSGDAPELPVAALEGEQPARRATGRARRSRSEPHSAPLLLGPDGWPAHVAKTMKSRRDLRGRPAPPFHATHWVTEEPAREGQVVLVCFWSTAWSSQRSLPRIQDLHERFGDEVVVIGLSNQAPDRLWRASGRPFGNAVRDFLDAHPELTFAQALDGTESMARALKLNGVPFVLIHDSRGFVRWQGDPDSPDDPLTPEVVAQIVRMDALTATAERTPLRLEAGELVVEGAPEGRAGVFFADRREHPPMAQVAPLACGARAALRLGAAATGAGAAAGRARLPFAGPRDPSGAGVAVRFWCPTGDDGTALVSGALALP